MPAKSFTLSTKAVVVPPLLLLRAPGCVTDSIFNIIFHAKYILLLPYSV